MYRKHLSQKASPSIRTTPINQEIAKSPSYGSLSGVVQKMQQDPNSVSEDERQQLESAIGSRSTREILAGKQSSWVPEFQGISAQIWGNSGQVAPIQAKRKDDVGVSKVQPENKTGLPDELKAGVENLSGIAMDDVRVHYNSSKPAELQALAYTQGTDIHVAPGQEKHLHHEAWHIVQQKQGRVKPTMQMKGVGVNDDEGLEREADVMGQQALKVEKANLVEAKPNEISLPSDVMQRRIAAWNIVQCNAGTTVYHNTGKDGAVSLCTDGVRQVQNAWGGGILGAGFYTHTTREGAEVYGTQRFTIEYTVTNNVTGQVVPRGVIARGIDNQNYPNGDNYVQGNDFLTNEDDHNEYKFHNGNNLRIVRIHDTVANRTYNAIERFLNAILQ